MRSGLGGRSSAAWPFMKSAAQGLVAHGLLALLGRAVEDDALAEHGRHEGVGGGLVELLVGGPEEGLLRLLAHHHHHAIAREVDLADLAQLVAHALEQLDRRLAQRLQVTEEGPRPGEDGGFLAAGVLGKGFGCAHDGLLGDLQEVGTAMILVSRYSSKPITPFSRPRPLCL